MDISKNKFDYLFQAVERSFDPEKLAVGAVGLYLAAFTAYFGSQHVRVLVGKFIESGFFGAIVGFVSFLAGYLILFVTAVLLAKICHDDEENEPSPGFFLRMQALVRFIHPRLPGIVMVSGALGAAVLSVVALLAVPIFIGRVDPAGTVFVAALTLPLVIIFGLLVFVLLAGLFVIPPVMVRGSGLPAEVIRDIQWLFSVTAFKLLWQELLAASFALLAVFPLAAVVYGVTHGLLNYETWVIGPEFLGRVNANPLADLTMDSSYILMGSGVLVFAFVFQMVASTRICRTLPNEL
jgi:hypothetical protein